VDETKAPRRLVVGIGNPDRGDDGAGPLVSALLRDRVPSDVRVLDSDGEVTRLLELLATADIAYLVDAGASGAPAGTVDRFDCASAPLPQSALQVSTHGLGPAEAIELARSLGQLPAQCVVYAIEAAVVGGGDGVSASVQRSAEQVADRIAAELAAEDSRGCAEASAV